MIRTFLRNAELPHWFSNRMSQRWDTLRINRNLVDVLKCPPASAAGGSSAVAEIHMLLCRRDLLAGIVALKSFLRFQGSTKFLVTITDDGSLDETCRRIVRAHVENVRFLRPVETTVLQHLENYPLVQKLYSDGFLFARKLCHPALMSLAERVVVLDSDTAFLRAPTCLLEWCKSAERGMSNMYLVDQRDEATEVPRDVKSIFAEIAPSGMIPNLFFNAGLLAFRSSDIDFEIANSYLDWRQSVDVQKLCSGERFWFSEWTIEQTCYLLSYAAMKDPAARSFGPEYAIGCAPDAVFCHFLSYYYRQSRTLKLLNGLIQEMRCGNGS